MIKILKKIIFIQFLLLFSLACASDEENISIHAENQYDGYRYTIDGKSVPSGEYVRGTIKVTDIETNEIVYQEISVPSTYKCDGFDEYFEHQVFNQKSTSPWTYSVVIFCAHSDHEKNYQVKIFDYSGSILANISLFYKPNITINKSSIYITTYYEYSMEKIGGFYYLPIILKYDVFSSRNQNLGFERAHDRYTTNKYKIMFNEYLNEMKLSDGSNQKKLLRQTLFVLLSVDNDKFLCNGISDLLSHGVSLQEIIDSSLILKKIVNHQIDLSVCQI